MISSPILSEGQCQQRFCHVQVGTTHARIRKCRLKLYCMTLPFVSLRRYMPNFLDEAPALISDFRFLRTVSLISATEAALLLENFIFGAV